MKVRLIGLTALILFVAALSSAATVAVFEGSEVESVDTKTNEKEHKLLEELSKAYGDLLRTHKISTVKVERLKGSDLSSDNRKYERSHTNPLNPDKKTIYVGRFPNIMPFELVINAQGQIFLTSEHSDELEHQIKMHLEAVTWTIKRMTAWSGARADSAKLEW